MRLDLPAPYVARPYRGRADHPAMAAVLDRLPLARRRSAAGDRRPARHHLRQPHQLRPRPRHRRDRGRQRSGRRLRPRQLGRTSRRFPRPGRLPADLASATDRHAVYVAVLAGLEQHMRGGRRPARATRFKAYATHPGPDVPASGEAAWLEDVGYQPIRFGALLVRHDLDDLPEPELPAGVDVRPVDESQLRQIFDAETDAFRGSWDFSEPSEEGFAAWRDDPLRDISLWKVAWHGDTVVGQVKTFVNDEENAERGYLRGYTEDIATHPDWRNRGIARALLAASLHELRRRRLRAGSARRRYRQPGRGVPALHLARLRAGALRSGVRQALLIELDQHAVAKAGQVGECQCQAGAVAVERVGGVEQHRRTAARQQVGEHRPVGRAVARRARSPTSVAGRRCGRRPPTARPDRVGSPARAGWPPLRPARCGERRRAPARGRRPTPTRHRRQARPAPAGPGRCDAGRAPPPAHRGRAGARARPPGSIHSSSSSGHSSTTVRHVVAASAECIGRGSPAGGCNGAGGSSATKAARRAAATAATPASIRVASSGAAVSATTSATGATGASGGRRRSVPSRAAVTRSRQCSSSVAGASSPCAHAALTKLGIGSRSDVEGAVGEVEGERHQATRRPLHADRERPALAGGQHGAQPERIGEQREGAGGVAEHPSPGGDRGGRHERRRQTFDPWLGGHHRRRSRRSCRPRSVPATSGRRAPARRGVRPPGIAASRRDSGTGRP